MSPSALAASVLGVQGLVVVLMILGGRATPSWLRGGALLVDLGRDLGLRVCGVDLTGFALLGALEVLRTTLAGIENS